MKSGAFSNVSLLVSSESLLQMENLDQVCPNALSFVFLSRHSSQSRAPALTCHSTGNFGEATFGGRNKELAIAFPALQKEYMKALFADRSNTPAYQVIIEATHHGPTSLCKPVLFIELGSSDEQWRDEIAALAICKTILSVLSKPMLPCNRVAIGFGGTHYPEVFNRLLIESDIGFASIASKHSLDSIDEAMLNQMIFKSAEKVTHAALDVKGLKGHRSRISRLAGDAGLELIEL